MDVDGLEAGVLEGGGHFDVSVDPLFAQNRDARGLADGNFRLFVGVERDLEVHAGVGGVAGDVVFLPGAGGVVADRLHLPGELGPDLAPAVDGAAEDGCAADADDDVARRGRCADVAGVESLGAEGGDDGVGVGLRDLQDAAELFAEERGEGVGAGDVGVESASAAEGHFGEGDGHAAVGAVVVGEDAARGEERLHDAEEGEEAVGVVEVWRFAADLREDLGERAAAEAVFAVGEVDENKARGAGLEVGRHGEANVVYGREGAHAEAERGLLAVGLAVGVPVGAHGERVLADGNRDAELDAEFAGDGLDGVEEAGVLARFAAGAHPVGGELDLADVADGRGGEVGERLADGHAAGGGGVGDGEGRAFADCHRLAGGGVEAGGGEGAVG